MNLLRVAGRLLLLSLAFTHLACAQKVASDVDYTHDASGWTMPIPRGWRVLPKDEMEQIDAKGLALLDDVADVRPTHLLYLRRDRLSTFTSTVLSMKVFADTAFDEVQRAEVETILKAYRNAGYPHRHALATERVGGVEFARLHVVLLAVDDRRELAQQWLYMGQVGDDMLTTTITSTNVDDRAIMLAAWRASTFAPTGMNAAASPSR